MSVSLNLIEQSLEDLRQSYLEAWLYSEEGGWYKPVMVVRPDWQIVFATPLMEQFLEPQQYPIKKYFRVLSRKKENLPADACQLRPDAAPYEIQVHPLLWHGTPAYLLELRCVQELETQQVAYSLAAQIVPPRSFISVLANPEGEALNALLEQVGERLKADRVLLSSLLMRAGQLLIRQQQGWHAQAIACEPEPDSWGKTGTLTGRGLDLWEDNLRNGEIIQAHVRSLPARQSAVFRALNIRSLMVIPIFVREIWWGILQIEACSKERTWSESEVYFARAIAGQFGAIFLHLEARNAISKLFQQELDSYKKALALFEASIALSSVMDWEVALDRTLTLLHEIVPFDWGSIVWLEEQNPVVLRILDLSRGTPRLQRMPSSPLISSVDRIPYLGPLLQSGKPVLFHDTLAEPGWIPIEQSSQRVRSWMGIPIQFEGQIVGFFSLGCSEPNAFDDKHVDWVHAYARAAGRVLQNARLFDEVAHALISEQRLNEISREINRTSELERMLQSVLRLTAQLVSSDMGTVGLYNPEDEVILIASTYNLPRPILQTRLVKGQGVAWEVLTKKVPLVLRDYAEHPQALDEWVQMGAHAYLGVPIVAGDEMLGVLNLFKLSPQRSFSDRDRSLAEMVGRQVGIAIQNIRRFEQAQRFATRDALTGLYTRRHFFEIARVEFERSRRYQRPMAVILMDVDNLKPINDTYGHLIGDLVLQKVALICQRLLRQMDVVGRFGGDEFIVLLPEATQDQALQIAERLREAIVQDPLVVEGKTIVISISQGIAQIEWTYKSVEQMVQLADLALNKAKQLGKNQVQVWDT
ncbi:MAG: diguanylate cyclase [Thermanaerothrix sp.]|nr:diguanylate cyclase [Thermanaerothrix sp.]